MPKILENLKESILKQSKQLLLVDGYEAFTMRKAATQCKIAVGTLYNYFESKDELIANIMFEDWQKALEKMKRECEKVKNLAEGLSVIYQCIVEFSGMYRHIWADSLPLGRQNLDYKTQHNKLIGQIAKIIEPLLRKEDQGIKQMDLFLAENILLCAGNSELEFSSFMEIIKKIIAE